MFALLNNLELQQREDGHPTLIRPENEAGNISETADFAYVNRAPNFTPNSCRTFDRIGRLTGPAL
jgi:hypothetical protein